MTRLNLSYLTVKTNKTKKMYTDDEARELHEILVRNKQKEGNKYTNTHLIRPMASLTYIE